MRLLEKELCLKLLMSLTLSSNTPWKPSGFGIRQYKINDNTGKVRVEENQLQLLTQATQSTWCKFYSKINQF